MIVLVASLFAGAVVMILHELPKALLYRFFYSGHGTKNDNLESENGENKTSESNEQQDRKEPIKEPKLWELHHYIDPIGLLFCGVLRVGFSKPYYYRIREKKTSRILGIAGLISLLLQFMISSAVLRFGFGMDAKLAVPADASISYLFFMYFLSCYAIISVGMLLSNLFPLVAFDMGLLIAAASPMKFYSILRGDYLIKMIWLFTALLGLLNTASAAIFGIFMG